MTDAGTLPLRRSTVVDPRAAEGAPGARRRVLIVDDEPHVLKAFHRILRNHYEVVLAEGGREGLDCLLHDARFDAVICDLSMPDVDGPTLHQEIVERAPELADRIIFCSGGACTARAREFLDNTPRRLLEKPVEPDQLRAAVADLCDLAA